LSRAPLVLLAVALGLAAALWFTQQREPIAPELGEAALGGRRLRDADVIRLRGSAQMHPIEVRRGPLGWDLVEPLRDVLRAGRLEELAVAWDSALLLPFPGKDLDAAWMKASGFDPALALLELQFGDERITIEVGEKTVLPGERFVRKGGRIYRGSEALFSTLQGHADDFRERIVFRIASPVDRLAIQRRLAGRDETLVLEQQGGGWRITSPIQARADDGHVVALVQALLGLKAARFLPGQLSQPPVPDYVVELSGPGGKEKAEFWLGPAQSMTGHHLGRGVLFELEPRDYQAAFEPSAQALRTALLLPGPVEQLVRIKLSQPGGPGLRLQRAGGPAWTLVDPVDAPVDPTALAELLSALRNLYAYAFVDTTGIERARMGLDERALQLEVQDQFQPRPVTILLGGDEGELTYAARADEEWVVAVRREYVQALKRSWPVYVGKEALRLNVTTDVLRLRLTEGRRVVEYARGDDLRWRREGDTERRSWPAAGEAVDVLRGLKPVRALDPREHQGRGEPVRLELKRGNGDVVETIEWWVEGERMLLRHGARPGILFELSARDARDLAAVRGE
jgi:hypothetical protein